MNERPQTHTYTYIHSHTTMEKRGKILSCIDVVFVYKARPSFKIWMIRSTCLTGRKSWQYTLYKHILKKEEGIRLQH